MPYPQSRQLSPSPAAPASQPSLLSCAFPLLPWGLRILPSPACPRHPHRAKAAWILLPSFPQAKNAQGSPREELFQNSPTLCITTQGIRGTGQGIRGPERANDLPGVIQLTSSRHPTPGLPRPTLELIAASRLDCARVSPDAPPPAAHTQHTLAHTITHTRHRHTEAGVPAGAPVLHGRAPSLWPDACLSRAVFHPSQFLIFSPSLLPAQTPSGSDSPAGWRPCSQARCASASGR